MSWWHYKRKPDDRYILSGLAIFFISLILLPIVMLGVNALFPGFKKGGEKWVDFLFFSVASFFVMLYLLFFEVRKSLTKKHIFYIILLTSILVYILYIIGFIGSVNLKLLNPPKGVIPNFAIFGIFFLLILFPLILYEERFFEKRHKKRKDKEMRIEKPKK